VTWFAVIEDATGRLASVGTILPPTLPAGYIAQTLAERPNFALVQWNAATRAFEPVPPIVWIDRLDDLVNSDRFVDFRTIWNSLNAANKTRLRNAMIALLGGKRFRQAHESEVLD
jgi:hypothetical protein